MPNTDRRNLFLQNGATRYLKCRISFLIVAGAVAAYAALFGEIAHWETMEVGAYEMRIAARARGFVRALDGATVASKKKAHPPLAAVVIDMAPEGRSPVGLDTSLHIYEFPVEGGRSRLLALLPLDATLSRMGSVRSARPYFIDIAREYGALLVHVGGSPEAISTLKKGGTQSLNEFAHGGYFLRDPAIKMPFNVFVSSDSLAAAFRTFKMTAKTLTPWKFKKPGTSGAEARFSFSYGEGEIGWRFDRIALGYVRTTNGAELHQGDGAPFFAQNVLFVFTDVESIDALDRKRVRTTGEGTAVLFRDGKKFSGRWEKKDASGRMKLFYADGRPMVFNRGRTWIEVVPVGVQINNEQGARNN